MLDSDLLKVRLMVRIMMILGNPSPLFAKYCSSCFGIIISFNPRQSCEEGVVPIPTLEIREL